ncbi:transcriptional regulator [Actinophytocola sp.]|uniref:transcriptional regulator n=1 Tax=Actinophytocola sp. TaxID=1872138 RepID=UPI003D6AD629
MAGKHGGGHGNGGPNVAPSDALRIDPEAVPALRSAFTDALSRVDEQLRLADQELRIAAWAKDPVSKDAATAFNERSVDTVASAIDSLRAYRDQLTVAVANLDKTAEQYSAVDNDGQSGVARNEDGG